jgi:hypothetical protein
VALAIVLWFIAGMALLVAGIVSQASVDIRMAQLHASRARVAAAGDGAIQLFMADVVVRAAGGGSDAGTDDGSGRYRLGEHDVAVTLVPARGLVDINTASADVLAALFELAGGAPPGDARYLADNVINWRTPKTSRLKTIRGGAKFSEIEDLLRVEGIGRTLLDGVRDYVAADNAVQGGTDWSLAPPAVLAILEKSDRRKYEAVTRRGVRLAGNPEAARPTSGGIYRADAVLRLGGRTWVRRRWVVLESSSDSLLPWRVSRSEAPRVVAE